VRLIKVEIVKQLKSVIERWQRYDQIRRISWAGKQKYPQRSDQNDLKEVAHSLWKSGY
jgi:hypothetical protein